MKERKKISLSDIKKEVKDIDQQSYCFGYQDSQQDVHQVEIITPDRHQVTVVDIPAGQLQQALNQIS